jgi:hypothetical protein
VVGECVLGRRRIGDSADRQVGARKAVRTMLLVLQPGVEREELRLSNLNAREVGM